MAEHLSRQGIVPIPVRPHSKIPCEPGWTEPVTETSDLAARFGGPEINIGVLLGVHSGNLVDVDLDCPEAIALAKAILPDTGWTHGRQSARSSHYCYIAPGCKTRKFVDPVDGTIVLEVRSDGCQTVVPPSRHASGELVEYEREGVPTRVDSDLLLDRVSTLAAATIFLRHYPENGNRHNATLALSGMLLNGGLDPDEVEWLVTIIAQIAGDEEWAERKSCVATTAARLSENQPVTGAPTLAKLIDERVVRSIAEALGIEWVGDSLPTTTSLEPKAPTKGLDIVTLGELYNEPEQDVRWLLDNRLGSGGVSVIGGNPKAGKSTFARALSIAVARGEPFLGWDTSQGPVFYAALEERRQEVRRHFQELGARAEDPIHVIFGHNERDLLEKIREAAAELNPVLLVIDTMQRLFHLEDINSYAEVSAKFNPLFEFANETGCHIAILHHTKKGRRKRSSSGEDLLGSQAIEGSVDCTILINRDGPDRTIETIQRIGPDLEKCALTLDPETGWPQIAGTLKAISESAIEQQILSVLEASGQITQVDLLKQITGTDAKIRPILARMVEEGKAVKPGAGRKGNPLFYEKPSNSEFPVSAFPDSISEEDNKYRNEGDGDVSPSRFPVPREKLETGNAQGEDRESSPSDAQTAGERDSIRAGVPDRDTE